MRARTDDGMCLPGPSLMLLAGVLWLILWHASAHAQDPDWQRYTDAGHEALSHGNYAETERQFQGALSVAESLPSHDPRLDISLSNLATLYHTREHYAQAEPFYQRLLTLREQVLGPTHVNVAHVLEHYAALLRTMYPVRSRFPWSAASRMAERAKRIRDREVPATANTTTESADVPAGWWPADDQQVFSDPG